MRQPQIVVPESEQWRLPRILDCLREFAEWLDQARPGWDKPKPVRAEGVSIPEAGERRT